MAGYKGHLAGGAVAAGLLAGTVAIGGSTFVTSLLLPLEGLPAEGLSAEGFPAWITTTWGGTAYAGAMIGVCLLASLWPDADTDSKGQRTFGAIATVAIGALIAAERFREASLIGLYVALPMMARHRGWTHRWWAALLVPVPIALVPYVYMPGRELLGIPLYLAAVAGYGSHLVVDGTA